MEPKDFNEVLKKMNVFTLQDLQAIKHRPDILRKLRFDVTPEMIMQPRLDSQSKEDVAGYFFYIETYEPPPTLMLMKVGKAGVTSTVGKVDEIPQEMVERAVSDPPEPSAEGMFAITEEIRDWLVSELGI